MPSEGRGILSPVQPLLQREYKRTINDLRPGSGANLRTIPLELGDKLGDELASIRESPDPEAR